MHRSDLADQVEPLAINFPNDKIYRICLESTLGSLSIISSEDGLLQQKLGLEVISVVRANRLLSNIIGMQLFTGLVKDIDNQTDNKITKAGINKHPQRTESIESSRDVMVYEGQLGNNTIRFSTRAVGLAAIYGASFIDLQDSTIQKLFGRDQSTSSFQAAPVVRALLPIVNEWPICGSLQDYRERLITLFGEPDYYRELIKNEAFGKDYEVNKWVCAGVGYTKKIYMQIAQLLSDDNLFDQIANYLVIGSEREIQVERPLDEFIRENEVGGISIEIQNPALNLIRKLGWDEKRFKENFSSTFLLGLIADPQGFVEMQSKLRTTEARNVTLIEVMNFFSQTNPKSKLLMVENINFFANWIKEFSQSYVEESPYDFEMLCEGFGCNNYLENIQLLNALYNFFWQAETRDMGEDISISGLTKLIESPEFSNEQFSAREIAGMLNKATGRNIAPMMQQIRSLVYDPGSKEYSVINPDSPDCMECIAYRFNQCKRPVGQDNINLILSEIILNILNNFKK
jgi:hypothetical protein